jgi:hypothetical protein
VADDGCLEAGGVNVSDTDVVVVVPLLRGAPRRGVGRAALPRAVGGPAGGVATRRSPGNDNGDSVSGRVDA